MKRAKNESYGKKVVAESSCPVTFTMGKIGGKWKPVILYLVQKDCNRFGRLQKAIAGVSKQMLTAQLRELEQDGILDRIIFAEIPLVLNTKSRNLEKRSSRSLSQCESGVSEG